MGGSKPSAPIPSLGLKECKNWNVDPVVNVLVQYLHTDKCKHMGCLPPPQIEKEVADLYSSWTKAKEDRDLRRRIKNSLKGTPRRKR